ncbi:MAG: hypothetical protein WB664_00705, partial [Nitrososphaeraceae archaeon]
MLRGVEFCLVSMTIIGYSNQVYAKIDPDIFDYHLKLAKGIVETCHPCFQYSKLGCITLKHNHTLWQTPKM